MFRLSLTTLVLSQFFLFIAGFALTPIDSIDELLYRSSLSSEILTDGASSSDDELRSLSLPYSTAGTVDLDQLAWCEDLIAQTFAVMPTEHVEAVHKLTLSFDPTVRRGSAGGNTMIIRCVNVEAAELVAIVIHELGHVVDTGLLHATSLGSTSSFVDRGKVVYSSDPSVDLYSISWQDNRSFTEHDETQDFVSLYAMTNPYEEFADAYLMYVLHGPLFRFYGYRNDSLEEKYAFMRDVVFDGFEFDFAPEELPTIVESNDRVYDISQLDFVLESFLALWALDSE
jgi:hypothetical protein